jgi:ADP-ribosyl-[dinitrogen reductase] hydrolase
LLIPEKDRYVGCLLGLACGDAVGTAVEFEPRGTFTPVTDMTGGGPFKLQRGQWTDDTSMALCLAHSLVQRKGFDAVDQMERYCKWENDGYMSSTGKCFDIGNTVRKALRTYRQAQDPFSGSTDPDTAGNGAIMRLAPVPMFYALSLAKTLRYSGESSRTTHAASEAIECARLFGAQLRMALLGAGKDEVLFSPGFTPNEPLVAAIANGSYTTKAERQVQGTGYVVASLEAALWCFNAATSYEETVLMAANLGDDADTTAAIAGQLAGAFYGVAAIPAHWREALWMRAEIEALALQLLDSREVA